MITTTSAINSLKPTYYCYDDYGNLEWASKTLPENGNISIMPGYNYNAQPVNQMPYSQTADGIDDGKISAGSKFSNFLKGLAKPITSMFSSPKNFIKGALGIAAGAALIAVTGGAAAPVLVAAGAIGGGIKFAKGAINAANAKTDAEAEAAWQDMGTGTFAVGASALSARKALGAAGVDTTGMSRIGALKTCIKGAPGFAKTAFATAKSNIGGWWSGLHATKGPNPQPTAKTIGPERQLPPGKEPSGAQIGADKQLPPHENNPSGTMNATGNTQAASSASAPQGEAQIFAEQMKNGQVSKADIIQYLKQGNPRAKFNELVRLLHPDSTGVVIDSTAFTNLMKAWNTLKVAA